MAIVRPTLVAMRSQGEGAGCSQSRLKPNPLAVAAELDARLGQFNEEHVGPRNTLNFVLSVRDGNGKLVGGLVGETLWNALLVSVLWLRLSRFE
jgi:hypothetical protein